MDSKHYIPGFQKGKNLESLSRPLVGRVVDFKEIKERGEGGGEESF
jgi:hypothetical protein